MSDNPDTSRHTDHFDVSDDEGPTYAELVAALRLATDKMVHGTGCKLYRYGVTCTCESRTAYDTARALLARVDGGGQ